MVFELWCGKAIECSEHYGNLETKDDSNAENEAWLEKFRRVV